MYHGSFHLFPGGSDPCPGISHLDPRIVQQHDQYGEENQNEDCPQGHSVSQADGHGDQELGLNAFFKEHGKKTYGGGKRGQDNRPEPDLTGLFHCFGTVFPSISNPSNLAIKYNGIVDNNPCKGHSTPKTHHGKGLTMQAVSPGNPQE